MKKHTILQSVKLLHEYQLDQLNPRERKFIKDMNEGLSGIGDAPDHEVMTYITVGQAIFVKQIAAKFLIHTTGCKE
jgi:hypothetical protein